MSRIAVLGAGAMGSAAATLLARHDDVDLLVLDVDAGRAARVAERARAEGRGFDAHGGELASALKDVSAFRADQMPYGGSKDSGFGREGLRYAMEEMTEPRIMVLSHVPL